MRAIRGAFKARSARAYITGVSVSRRSACATYAGVQAPCDAAFSRGSAFSRDGITEL